MSTTSAIDLIPPTFASSATDVLAVKSKTDLSKELLEQQCKDLKVPGYAVETDGVFTIVRRTSSTGRSAAFPARIIRWLLSSNKWLPYLFRFTKESMQLSPWRMAILLVSKIVSSLAPTARLWVTSYMLSMVEHAISTGEVNKLRLGIYAILGAVFSTGFGKINVLFARNAGVLERYFEAMVTGRLLAAASTLDLQAANAPQTNKLFVEAAMTVHFGSDQAFKIIADVVKVFTSALGVATQAFLLRKTINRNNIDLIMISFAANLISEAKWLFRGDPGVESASTNQHYHRMQNLWRMTRSTTSESILLGIPKYLSGEYDKANEALGPLWTYRLKDQSRLARTTEIFKNISEPAVYALFALRAAARQQPSSLASSLFSDTFSMGSLAFIQNASTALAEEIARFFYTLDDVRQHCTQVLQFYKALDVKPAMKQPEHPVKYITQVARGPTPKSVTRGMGIELKSVSFKYPGSEHYALEKVSFNVKPGSLLCIVGYNGAGKSTLINLITRVVDPSEGEVLTNGIDARKYTAEDLYSKITCQFQSTEPADVTLREFLHMGDVSDLHDEEKMLECIKIAGIEKVIARFPKGLDARLGPYPADPTPQSFLKEFVQDCQNGTADPWEEEFEQQVAKEIEEDEEWEDEVVGGAGASGGDMKGKECAFSPGEWQKLCFARSLMKRNADLRIFDEPSASLDPLASRRVFEKIDNLRGHSTVVHITHDLSGCLKADQVLMFEEGKNIESGTHEELLAKIDSKYRQFYMASLGQDDEESDASEKEASESDGVSADDEASHHDGGSESNETAWEDDEEITSLVEQTGSPEDVSKAQDEVVLQTRRDKSDSNADEGFHGISESEAESGEKNLQ